MYKECVACANQDVEYNCSRCDYTTGGIPLYFVPIEDLGGSTGYEITIQVSPGQSKIDAIMETLTDGLTMGEISGSELFELYVKLGNTIPKSQEKQTL